MENVKRGPSTIQAPIEPPEVTEKMPPRPPPRLEFETTTTVYENTCGEDGARVAVVFGSVRDVAALPARELASNVLLLEVRAPDGKVLARFRDFDLKVLAELAEDTWRRTRGGNRDDERARR